MGWEFRQYKGRSCGPYFVCRKDGERRYVGRKPTAAQLVTEDQRRALREQKRVEYKQFQALDAQLTDLTRVTKTLVNATLLGSGYHQHKREWRKRRINNIYDEGQHFMDNDTLRLETETASYGRLETLVQNAQQGDTTTLPAIRQLLDRVPEVWEGSRVLAQQIERSWINTISGRDLISQEILEREVNALRTQLQGSNPSPIETLLIERICSCWLAIQHAELIASKRLTPYTFALSNAEENRLDKTNRRFLASVRELAKVRKLLTPETRVQVNVGAQQQVVNRV